MRFARHLSLPFSRWNNLLLRLIPFLALSIGDEILFPVPLRQPTGGDRTEQPGV